MTSISNVASSEWLKLRTIPLHYVLWAIGGCFVAVITLLVAALNGAPRFFGSDELATLVGGTGVVAALAVGVVSILAITGEFAHGTIRPALVAVPSRPRFFATKAGVIALVALVLGAVIAWVSYVLGLVVFNGRGADIGLSTDDGSVAVMIGLPIFFVLLSMFGYGLGLLMRNAPGAIAVLILWPLLVENIIGGVLTVSGVDEPTQYLPYQSSFALIVADTEGLYHGRIAGGLFFAVVVAALVALGIFVNNRRDV